MDRNCDEISRAARIASHTRGDEMRLTSQVLRRLRHRRLPNLTQYGTCHGHVTPGQILELQGRVRSLTTKHERVPGNPGAIDIA